jgi:endonuclease/exonuclease/phosphatase family metal-dependent hydrolase
MKLRFVNWNVALFRQAPPKAALLQAVMAEVDVPVIVCLQEVQPKAREFYAALFDAHAYSLVHRKPQPLDGRNRQLGVLVGVRSADLRRSGVVAHAPYPDRSLWADVSIGEYRIHVLAAHALTGADYRRAKADQFLALARHLAGREGHRLLGIDANEPKVDALDAGQIEFFVNKDGGRGARTLLGKGAPHGMQCALRLSLPPETTVSDPIATSYCTRSHSRRYDHCLVSNEWQVAAVEYRYQAAMEAGSDHAIVVVDLVVDERPEPVVPLPPQRDGTPDLEAVRRVLARKSIPPGQIALFKALLEAGETGLDQADLAEIMRDGDVRGLAGVLGGLGKRVNQTPGFTEARPGARYLVHRSDAGRYRALPLLRAAIGSYPSFEAVLQLSYTEIYDVRAQDWFHVSQG